jgi:hypothetical protein
VVNWKVLPCELIMHNESRSLSWNEALTEATVHALPDVVPMTMARSKMGLVVASQSNDMETVSSPVYVVVGLETENTQSARATTAGNNAVKTDNANFSFMRVHP